MIDDFSPCQAWERFFAQRDGTPFTPFTEQQLESQLPSDRADKARVRDRDIIHADPTISGAK